MHHRSASKIWNDPVYRGIGAQVLLLACCIGLFIFFVNNAASNLREQGIASGFAFLQNPAGFDIIQHFISYNESDTFWRAFLVSLLNTLVLAFLAIIFATIIGFIAGVARLSSNWLVCKLAGCYIEIFRNVPLLLQIFFWYFAVLRLLPIPRQSINFSSIIFLNNRGLYLPQPIFLSGAGIVFAAFALAIVFSIMWYQFVLLRQQQTGERWPVLLPSLGACIIFPLFIIIFLTGVPLEFGYPALTGFNFEGGTVIIPELVAMLLGLTMYTGTYIGETVRCGILSVSQGQIEAAKSLGLYPGLRLRLIIIPQAMRVIIPPLANQYMNIVKNSSLSAAIAYPDLVAVFAGTVLNQTGQAIEVIAMTMSVYLTVCLTVSYLMNVFNKRMAFVER